MDPKKVFTYVEMKYFSMWYERQNPKKQEEVKSLIQSGRFEITMGGWSGPDECDANYEDLIGNF